MIGHDTETALERESRWALRLVHTVAPEPFHQPATVLWVSEAVRALAEMFDEAVEQANATLARFHAPHRIASEQCDNQHRFTFVADDGGERWITLFLTPSTGGAHGGARLSTSQSRASIYLIPVLEKNHPGWRTEMTGLPFTTATVHDLFLSVFADDPASTLRLSPLGGHDLFQSPWG